jgi:hypothetical protein
MTTRTIAVVLAAAVALAPPPPLPLGRSIRPSAAHSAHSRFRRRLWQRREAQLCRRRRCSLATRTCNRSTHSISQTTTSINISISSLRRFSAAAATPTLLPRRPPLTPPPTSSRARSRPHPPPPPLRQPFTAVRARWRLPRRPRLPEWVWVQYHERWVAVAVATAVDFRRFRPSRRQRCLLPVVAQRRTARRRR